VKSTKKPDIRARAAAFAKGETKGRTPPSGSVRLTVNIDAQLHRRFKIAAVASGRTMGEMLEDWIREHVGDSKAV